MKKLLLSCSTIFVLLFSVNVLAGQPMRNLDPGVANPGSSASGNSLDEWMGVYLRWLENGQNPDEQENKVAFLPILGVSPFEVTVKPGTKLVLPVATWLGSFATDTLPDEWWGDPAHIFGNVYLDGVPILEPNDAYYVGPTDLDPPVFGAVLYQALVIMINPLPPGAHQIVLHSEFVDFGAEFDNTWNITVEK